MVGQMLLGEVIGNERCSLITSDPGHLYNSVEIFQPKRFAVFSQIIKLLWSSPCAVSCTHQRYSSYSHRPYNVQYPTQKKVDGECVSEILVLLGPVIASSKIALKLWFPR